MVSTPLYFQWKYKPSKLADGTSRIIIIHQIQYFNIERGLEYTPRIGISTAAAPRQGPRRRYAFCPQVVHMVEPCKTLIYFI